MSDALPDIIAPHLTLVFCGINPGATAAAAGFHFVNASNRFWRVLHLAGFTPEQIRPENDRSILNHGYGLTTAVARPTQRAAELSRDELRFSAAALERKIAHYAPGTLAFLGKAAHSAIVGMPHISWGPQAGRFGGAAVWVVPNPSGLNRGFSLGELVDAYTELRLAVIG
jgi:TDG/mug DNA glycosylase family protein